jgi:small-conductance mechanosensitive channel
MNQSARQKQHASRCRLRGAAAALIAALAVLLGSAGAHAQGKTEPTDRSTPRRTIEGLVRAGRTEDPRAAEHLDLRGLPPTKQLKEGPVRARQLALILEWTLVDITKVSDDPEGDPSDGPGSDVIATVELEEDSVPIVLTRTREGAGHVWQVSKTTVAMIQPLYAAHGARWLGDRMPEALQHRLGEIALWQWIGVITGAVISYAIAYFLTALMIAFAGWIVRRTAPEWDDDIIDAARRPVRLTLTVAVFGLLTSYLHLPATVRLVLEHGGATVIIAAAAWLLIRLIHLGAGSLQARLPGDTVGELRSRGLRTHLVVMKRVSSILIAVIAVSVILTQFEGVRSFGTSLLASAGIAGIVLGIAAQKTLGAVIGGVQLSITQPLRIGDSVVLENEYGTVEEINLTYVVLKIWDERRLIVPVTRLLEQPFQNWTRGSAQITGVVMVHVDYSTPVDEVRAELERLVRDHPGWDGRICKLQVTDATDKTMVLRAHVSSTNAEHSFDLRCDVREGLLRFLHERAHGAHLPTLRSANIDREDGEPDSERPGPAATAS